LWLHPNGFIDSLVIDNLINSGEFIVNALDYTLIPEIDPTGEMRTLGIDGTHGLWIGDPCNGITLFALFTGFVIAYPGPVKRKIWFIPLGLFAIHIVNILRIVALAFITLYAPSYLEFNHTYTFTIIVYSFVFFLWMLWANKFSKPEEPTSNN
jgi:exosortase family protein XrtF